MSDVYDGPFGGYADVTQVIAGATLTRISAEVAKLKALIPDGTAVASTKPDFDEIPAHTASKLRTEIDAMEAALIASAT